MFYTIYTDSTTGDKMLNLESAASLFNNVDEQTIRKELISCAQEIMLEVNDLSPNIGAMSIAYELRHYLEDAAVSSYPRYNIDYLYDFIKNNTIHFNEPELNEYVELSSRVRDMVVKYNAYMEREQNTLQEIMQLMDVHPRPGTNDVQIYNDISRFLNASKFLSYDNSGDREESIQKHSWQMIDIYLGPQTVSREEIDHNVEVHYQEIHHLYNDVRDHHYQTLYEMASLLGLNVMNCSARASISDIALLCSSLFGRFGGMCNLNRYLNTITEIFGPQDYRVVYEIQGELFKSFQAGVFFYDVGIKKKHETLEPVFMH